MVVSPNDSFLSGTSKNLQIPTETDSEKYRTFIFLNRSESYCYEPRQLKGSIVLSFLSHGESYTCQL